MSRLSHEHPDDYEQIVEAWIDSADEETDDQP